MKILKIKLKKIEEFFKKLPKKISQKAFLIFFLLVLIFLILGYFIFYHYSILEEESQVLEKPVEFKKENYQKILEFWKESEEKLRKIEQKEYPDFFRGLTEK